MHNPQGIVLPGLAAQKMAKNRAKKYPAYAQPQPNFNP
jgi:hypothetical protein